MRTRSIVTGLAFMALAVLAALLPSQRESSALCGCTFDQFEGNNSPETARPVTIPYDQDSHVLCESEPFDYFSFHLSQGEEVQIDVIFSQEFGDIGLNLEHPDGLGGVVSETQPGGKKIAYTATTSGTHQLGVLLQGVCMALLCNDKDGGMAYDLRITKDPACKGCGIT